MKKKSIITILTFIVLIVNGTGLFAQNGDNLFDDTFIHIIEINSIVPQSYDSFHDSLKTDWWDHYYEHTLNGQQRRSYFMASVSIDGEILDTVGVRYKGLSTMEFAPAIDKYPIKIDFNEFVRGQDFDGMKKVNLHSNLLDVTVMRAKLAFEILNRMGVKSPRVSYAKTFLNGSYRGLYCLVEQIDKTFVRNNFDPDSTGILHKIYGFRIKDDDPNTPWNINNTYGHHKYSNPLKTKKSTDNYQPLIDLGIAASTSTDEEFKNDINGIFDMESFIKQQAVNIILSDGDKYCTAAWNYYLYLNPEDNKWYMVPWDYDISFGAQSIVIEDPTNWYAIMDSSVCFLNGRLMAIPEMKERYFQSLCDVINYGMDSLWINNRIEEIKNIVSSEVENDPFFWDVTDYETYLDQPFTTNDPQNYLNGITILGLRDYINKRFDEVRTALSNQGFNCEMTTTSSEVFISNNLFNLAIYPNPTCHSINVKSLSDDVAFDQIKILNTLGQEVFIDKNLKFEKEITIDLANLSNGIYYLTVSSNESSTTFTERIVMQK